VSVCKSVKILAGRVAQVKQQVKRCVKHSENKPEYRTTRLSNIAATLTKRQDAGPNSVADNSGKASLGFVVFPVLFPLFFP